MDRDVYAKLITKLKALGTKINEQGTISSESLTGTTGDTAYDGYYYADIAITGNISNVISVFVVSCTGNRSAFVTWVGDAFRVWTKTAEDSVGIKVTYKTAVGGT